VDDRFGMGRKSFFPFSSALSLTSSLPTGMCCSARVWGRTRETARVRLFGLIFGKSSGAWMVNGDS
jgi:hypothetical protein